MAQAPGTDSDASRPRPARSPCEAQRPAAAAAQSAWRLLPAIALGSLLCACASRPPAQTPASPAVDTEAVQDGTPRETTESAEATAIAEASEIAERATVAETSESSENAASSEPGEATESRASSDASAASADSLPAESPVVAAPAAEPKPQDTPKGQLRRDCERPEAPDELGRVADMQEVIEETTCVAALWMDGLFGEGRNLDEARKTSGYLEVSSSYSEFEGADQRVRFRVRFRLPNLKDRLNLIVGRDDEEEIQRDRTERFAVRSQLRNIENDSAWLAGLGYSLPGTERFSSDFRIGVSSLSNPKLYLQQPTRYVLYSDTANLLYVRGTPFWNNLDGFGITAGINYDHALSSTLLLRLTEVGTVSEKTEGYDWFAGTILYQNLRNNRALSYQLLIRGATDAAEPLYEYGARMVFRQPLIEHRLYGELLGGYTWPRDDPSLAREGSAEVGFSLEMPFGEKRR